METINVNGYTYRVCKIGGAVRVLDQEGDFLFSYVPTDDLPSIAIRAYLYGQTAGERVGRVLLQQELRQLLNVPREKSDG